MWQLLTSNQGIGQKLRHRSSLKFSAESTTVFIYDGYFWVPCCNSTIASSILWIMSLENSIGFVCFFSFNVDTNWKGLKMSLLHSTIQHALSISLFYLCLKIVWFLSGFSRVFSGDSCYFPERRPSVALYGSQLCLSSRFTGSLFHCFPPDV